MLDVTVGQLKELIKDLPDDVILYNERIEDIYFKEHGWKTTKIEEVHYPDSEGEFYPVNTLTYKDGRLLISGHY